MVIAIITIGLGLFITNSDQIIDQIASESPQETVFRAVSEARMAAVDLNEVIYLSYDEDENRLYLYSQTGESIDAEFRFETEGRFAVDRILMRPVISESLFGNTPSSYPINLAEEYQPSMAFYPTGVSQFCGIELYLQSTPRNPFYMIFDPFSNGLLESEVDP